MPSPSRGWRGVCLAVEANPVTEVRLGEVSNANEAGNLVLCDVALDQDHRPCSAPTIQTADQDRGGGHARQRGNQGRGSAGLSEAPGGGIGMGTPSTSSPGGSKAFDLLPLAPDDSCHVI